jgi:putative DNA primase/helicase
MARRNDTMSASAGATEFVRAMGPVARELLGEPSEDNKAKRELRFGTRGSLKISLDSGTWFCNETNTGGGVLALVQDRKRLDKDGAIAWLQERGHIPKVDQPKPSGGRQVAWYDYLTASGEPLFQVVRFDPKDFRQRRPDGNGGWIWKMAGVQLVPYRLPEVVRTIGEKRTIYIAEGEKGVHALESLGLVATCSPGGAGKWRASYNSTFAGADVVVLPDNDPQATTPDGELRWHPDGRPILPGQDHGADVARNLSRVARRVRVLMLPVLPLKGDVADWVAAGGTAEALERLAADTADFDPATNPKPKPAPAPTTSLDGFDLTEDGIALAFAKEHQDRLRYDHSIGKWFQWTGKAWRQDETKLAFSWARRTCRQLAKEDGAEDGELRTIARASTAAAVERFAQADPALAVTSAIWDRDLFVLGTPGGTLDLRTGKLRDPTREDHITKLTSVTPSVMPDCPQWETFLEQVTAGDTALIRFLKQWCGYCLTGDTREHALLFAHGPGGNGKGVFLNTVSWIMGDYARTAAMDTFVSSQSDKHPTDLAMLRGARMVTASETEEGRAWAEARIKALTGGDTISARFMRQDFFEYQPQFKLTIIGNHKPVLKNVDEAARRRMNMVPFLYKPPVKDMQLEEKLRAEGPGILRWMIEGGLDWQKNGLVRPEVVTMATAEYFAEQDLVNQWIEDCCVRGKHEVDTRAALFKNWTSYALANGERPGTTKWFKETLERLGCVAVDNTPGKNGTRGYKGIALKPVEMTDRTEPQQYDDHAR